MSLIIRRAFVRDVPALAQLLYAHLDEHQRQHPDAYPALPPAAATERYAEEWTTRLASDPTCYVWLAADRALRGFLAGEVWTRPVGEPHTCFFVDWIYVVPESRGAGIAHALWRPCLELCARQGIDVVEGNVVPSDTQWARRGYRTVSTRIMRSVVALAADLAASGRTHTGESWDA